MANLDKNATMSIDFIAFKKAMKNNSKDAGKVMVYYADYMYNKINIETFFQAMKELDKKSSFIVDATADMDEIVCDLNQSIQEASIKSFQKNA